ncbi:MAG: family 43 glycosylhydrolase [Oscillospiraceae bacterium]|jgi:hypothetical protein|nr:family 43 glycosylhydrolase [Oscillospiraceae bacterium]
MQNFRLDRAAFMLDKGQRVPLIAACPEGLSLRWSSNAPGIAAVDAAGVVTGMGEGDALIRAALLRDGAIIAERSCLASVGYQGQNPTLPPSWQLFIADGEPHVFDGKVYVYGSRDNPEGYMEGAPKSDWCSDSYHVIWSEDLIHWTDAGVALTIADVPEAIRADGTRLWAPDLFQSPKDGRFYLTFCTNTSDVFIADADTPVGPFANVRRITLGGERIHAIDPGVLVDGDTVYIALPKPFFIAKLDPEDYSRVLPETQIILDDIIAEGDPAYYPFEGPSLRKHGDYYYYIYIASRNGEKVPTRMDYLIAKDPMNPGDWRYGGHFIETRDFIHAGNVHGSFCVKDGQAYLSYHRMAQGYRRFTRTMNLDKMNFDADGRAQIVTRTSSGAKGAFALGETIYAASACAFEGGREDNRFLRLDPADAFPAKLPEYACVLLAKEEAVFRYADTRGARTITLCYRADAPFALTLRAGETTISLQMPGTRSYWALEVHPIALPEGLLELGIAAELPEGANAALGYLRLDG